MYPQRRMPESQSRFNAPIAPKHRRHRGTSLAEVMLAALVLVIAILGVSSTYVSGRRHLIGQRYYQAAAQLASQQLEEIRSLGYDDIIESEDDSYDEEQFYREGIQYTRQTRIQLTAEPSATTPKPCKKATVVISWSYGTQQHEARLCTYIGP